MRTQKTGPAGHQNTLLEMHGTNRFFGYSRLTVAAENRRVARSYLRLP
jgi:hypothetical protein